MRREQLSDYRRRLMAMRQDTQRSLDALQQGLEQSLRDSTVEFSTYDNHPADVASETFEREKDFSLREDQLDRLTEIEAALGRIDDGSFGRCTACGQEIETERLRALPYASRCLHCQLQREDPARDRPIEESLENELLRRSFTDQDPRGNVGFDGEDAWQAAARHGTSNTPGDFRQVEDYDHVFIDNDETVGTVFDVEALPQSFDDSRAEFAKRPHRRS